MISIYSVVSSIIFYNLSLVLLFILRRKTDFIARYAISTLLFLSVLSMVRLFVPVDFDAAYVIRSEKLIPSLINLLESKPGIWPVSVGNTLLAVWAVGSVVHAIKICVHDYKAHKSRRIYPKIRSEQLKRVSAKLDKDYKIVLSPKVSQPYTVGIFRPTIYLPYIEYSDNQLYYILLHEAQHIKSRDNLKHFVFLIVETIFWWNPLAYIASDDFELLTEYSCDSKVTINMDYDTVRDYLGTIVSVVKRLNPDEDKAKPKLSLMFAQTDNNIQRFEVLLRRNDHKPKRIRYTVWLIMLLVFIMSFFVIIQPYYGTPSVYSETGFLINPDNSYISDTNGCYFLVYNGTIIGEITEEKLVFPPYNDLTIIGE